MTDFPHRQTPYVDLSRMLSDLVNDVEELDHAVVASEDGVPVTVSTGVSTSDAETLAVVSAALASLAAGTAGRFEAGAVHAVVVRLQRGQLTVVPARGGSLVLYAQSPCDVAWLINQAKPVMAALDLRARMASDSSHQEGVRCGQVAIPDSSPTSRHVDSERHSGGALPRRRR